MSKKVNLEVEKFLLPFSALSEKGNKSSDSFLELAAVFSMAELNRRKSERLSLWRPKEKIAFVTEIGYPLWLFPLSNRVLLFDGLNVFDYSMPYDQIPDVKSFVEGLKASCKAHETHLAFLAEHVNYFSTPASEKSLPLRGLISDPSFLEEAELYRREAMRMESRPTYMGLLSSPIDESRLSFITHEMSNLRAAFEKEIKALNSSIQLLGKTAQIFLNELHDEVKATKEEYAQKIKEEELIVAPQVEKLREQYDIRIIELTRSFERQYLPLQKDKRKLEKSKDGINEKIAQYSVDARNVAESDDTLIREQWKQKLKDAKRELSTVEEQLRDNQKALEGLDKKRVSETFRFKSELEASIKEARKNLVELEASRDAKVMVAMQEMDELEKRTKLLCDQIGKTIKLREEDLAQFEKLCMEQCLEKINKALVYVPFYVVCYDSGEDRRYLVLPPSSVGTIDISTRLKGALGRARIKSFLVPRFKEISVLAETVQKLSKENGMFEAELVELGTKNNILEVNSIVEGIEEGLLSLKNQGWLSDKDYGAIIASIKTNLNMN